jgi:L-fucose isomerase-like protein
MGKIGFVSISHQDYLDGTVTAMTRKALEECRRTGHTIVEAGCIVTTDKAARKTGIEFAASDLDGVVVLFGGWMECPITMSLLREVEHLPLCVWGFPMFETAGKLDSTGSYVSYTMFKGVLDRIGWKYIGLLGSIDDDPAVYEKLCAFCAAAESRQRLKRCKIGLVGSTSMGIYTGTFDHVLMRTRIGPEIEHIDSYTVIQKAEQSSPEAKQEVVARLAGEASVNPDIASGMMTKTAGVYCGLRRCVDERELDGINVKCQYEFSKEYKCVPCVPLSLLADEGTVASCEGDILCTVSMMILHYLSGSVVSYGDAMHHEDGTVKLSSCGFVPFSMGAGNRRISNFLPHPGFTGIQPSFVMKPGKVTVLRLIEGIGSYRILYFTGTGLDTELRQGYMPALDIRIDGDISRLVEHYSGQHYAICYGDVSGRIEALCTLMGIESFRI